MIKIYVGNLPPAASEEEVYHLFGRYGDVHAVALMSERGTGRRRGFGYVTMDDGDARRAIAACRSRTLRGHRLLVHEVRSMEEHSGDEGGTV